MNIPRAYTCPLIDPKPAGVCPHRVYPFVGVAGKQVAPNLKSYCNIREKCLASGKGKP